MTAKIVKGRGSRAGARRLLAVVLAAAPWLAACNTDNLLKVSAPTLLPSGQLLVPSQAALLVNGAVADFECAFASSALVEGIISDEFQDAQLGAAAWDYDRRSANQFPGGSYGVNACDNNQTPGIYAPLSTARYDADAILKAVQGWKPSDVGTAYDSLTATAALYAGFSYAMMAMSMCNAAFDLGPQQTQAQMFALAEQRFSTALTSAQKLGSKGELYAAYVGRARVRLFQGNTAGADADAKLVPAGFEYDATYSDANNRRYNRLYAATVKYGFYSIETGSRAIMVEGIPDPRVPVYNTGVNGADRTQIWATRKWTSLNDPIRLASSDEARLIQAEAEYTANPAAAIALINALRDEWSIPHYNGATDAASVKQLIINERRAILFGEGQRNYDYQRFNLPFPAYSQVGANFPAKGGTYGNTTCLPLPDIERLNNPNIGG